MPSLSELLTPTFLMFLGILLLVVALVVVYFESKMRDQNHKIASMLSLVSTLAEDMNGVKMGLNQVAMHQMSGQQMPQQMGGQQMAQMNQMGVQSQPLENSNKSLYLQEANNLIAVSDDDDSEEDTEEDDSAMDDSGSDIDAASLSDEEEESDDESSDDDEPVMKVLRLNIPHPGKNEDNDLDEAEELGDLDDLMDEELSVSSEDSSEYQLDIPASDFISAEEIKDETHLNISASDLKTINISLEEGEEEHGVESVDYKKLPLPKLRNIVTEKGLAADAAKMKKNELLKLLESE
jgi:hypothetical protein